MQLIPRLYDAESGTVRVGGVDVRDYNLAVCHLLHRLLCRGQVRCV